MKMPRLKLLLAFFIVLFAVAANAQINKFYTDYKGSDISKRQAELANDIKKFRLVKQDIQAIQSFRQSISAIGKTGQSSVVAIPLVDDRDISFQISPVQTLSNESGAAFPQIQTYTGISADKAMKLRLTISQLGMMGTVRIKGEPSVHYLTIPDNEQPDMLIAFKAADANSSLPILCKTDERGVLQENIAALNLSKRVSGDCALRTYRFAVAATGEYTTWAGNQANAAALITTTVNNINEVYERDFTIHLNLVLQMNNIYTDPSTDPYSNNLDNTLLTQNNDALNSNTGAANYDLGVVFGYGNGWSGGIAGVGIVCTTGKGRGAGGLNNSFSLGSKGPIFDNVIAHEVGHQFSATHTMAANNGSCNGNVTGSTGWEPGGGSTIMAYAGSCAGNAYQINSDDYFHGGSIAQVLNYVMNGNGKNCAVLSSAGNNAPTISVPQAAYDIPYNTPFVLTANASDANAGDVLTYTWEQMDAVGGSGISTPPVATASSGPMFRSFIPSISPERYFPGMDVLLGKTSGIYEVLPAVARNMHFKVTVRDNHSGGGCTAYEDVAVNVQNCGAFEITNLTTASGFTADGSSTITLNWNTASCVAMPNIDVLFSTDGGMTYPYTILAGTANDGTETFVVPNLPTCKGRFMIRSIGNIYYNINAADITIASACTANGTTFSPSADFSAPGAGDASLNLTETPVYGNAISLPVTGSISSTDPSGNLSFYDENTSACSGPSNVNHYDIVPFYPSVSGQYTFHLTSPFGLLINIYSDTYQPANVCANFIASSAVKKAGNTSVSPGIDVAATFCAGLKYVLVISSFGNTTPVLPADYSVNIFSAPTGAGIFTGQKNPSLNYSYITVNSSTGKIVEVKSTADLTDQTKYLSNNSYTIYGISSSETAGSLSSQYTGVSFTQMRSEVQGQTGGLCAQLSANSRRIMIGNAVLPAKLLSFSARLLNEHRASLTWNVTFEHNVKTYSVERSTDAVSFNQIGNVAAFNMNSSAEQSYSYIDEAIPADITKVFYRLKIEDIDGKIEYSTITALQLNRKWSARIYPNPIQQSSLELFIDALSTDNVILQVIDMSGRIAVNKNARINKGPNKITIPVQLLTNGMYMLQIKGQAENATLNFIKR